MSTPWVAPISAPLDCLLPEQAGEAQPAGADSFGRASQDDGSKLYHHWRHSIGDDEIKFGLCRDRSDRPRRVLANAGARAGDHLILTKRIGTGSSPRHQAGTRQPNSRSMPRCLHGHASPRRQRDRLADLKSMPPRTSPASACLGHARKWLWPATSAWFSMPSKSSFCRTPLNTRAKVIAGGLKRNREFLTGCVEIAKSIPDEVKNLLYDPQTSGGLLLSWRRTRWPSSSRPFASRIFPPRTLVEVVGRLIP